MRPSTSVRRTLFGLSEASSRVVSASPASQPTPASAGQQEAVPPARAAPPPDDAVLSALETTRIAQRNSRSPPRLQAVHLNRPEATSPPTTPPTPDPAVLSALETTRAGHRGSRAPPRLQAVHLNRPPDEASVKVAAGVEVQRMRKTPAAAARLQAIHLREKEGDDLRTRHLPPGGGDREEAKPAERRGLLSWLSRS